MIGRPQAQLSRLGLSQKRLREASGAAPLHKTTATSSPALLINTTRRQTSPALLLHASIFTAVRDAPTEFMTTPDIQNLKTFDPFAEADDDSSEIKGQTQDYIHIRIQRA